MNRPDVLLLLLPIIGVLAWHARLIHRYGWQSELCGEEPRRDHPERPTAALLTSDATSEEPASSSPQSPGYWSAVQYEYAVAPDNQTVQLHGWDFEDWLTTVEEIRAL